MSHIIIITVIPSCSPSSSSWFSPSSVAQWDHHLNVVVGEESHTALYGALEPVLVDAAGQGDEVALAEAQLAGVLGLKVVQGLTAGLRWGRRGGGGGGGAF